MRFRGIVHPVDEKVKALNRKEVSVMSERTINENQKIWAAAEKIAEEAVAAKKAASEEERRKQKKRVVKIVLLMILIALIIVFASIAWFAMNKAVSADTMAIEAKDASFEIAVKGSAVRNNTEMELADSTYEDGNEKTYNDDSYYETGGSVQKVKIRYNPVADEQTDFGPDSSGVIEFYIVPKQDGDLTVKIDLDAVGFRELGEGNSRTIKRISELTTDDGLDQATITQYQNAENYLKGHIMYFEALGNAGTGAVMQYYYQKPITTRTLTKTFTNARKDVPQLVTVYWMWTNTLGQIALRNDSNLQGIDRSGIPIVEDVTDDAELTNLDKGKVIQYLKDNKQQIFTNSVLDTEIDNAKVEANFKKLSTGYNDADFLIGSSVSYFMIDISVQKS